MSRWRRERLALGLDACELSLGGLPAARSASDGSAPGWTAARLRDALQALRPAGQRRAAAHVLVGADLCRHFVQQAPAGLRSLAELQALSATRAAQLYGGEPGNWSVVADWHLARPFVCAALPAALLLSLRQAAVELGLALTVASALLAALERVMPLVPDEGFVAWDTPEGAVLVYVSADGVRTWRQLRRRPSLQAAELADLLALEAVQEGLRAGVAARSLRLASGQASQPATRWADGMTVEHLDAHAVLPEAVALDTEARWAARLAASMLERA